MKVYMQLYVDQYSVFDWTFLAHAHQPIKTVHCRDLCRSRCEINMEFILNIRRMRLERWAWIEHLLRHGTPNYANWAILDSCLFNSPCLSLNQTLDLQADFAMHNWTCKLQWCDDTSIPTNSRHYWMVTSDCILKCQIQWNLSRATSQNAKLSWPLTTA